MNFEQKSPFVCPFQWKYHTQSVHRRPHFFRNINTIFLTHFPMRFSIVTIISRPEFATHLSGNSFCKCLLLLWTIGRVCLQQIFNFTHWGKVMRQTHPLAWLSKLFYNNQLITDIGINLSSLVVLVERIDDGWGTNSHCFINKFQFVI